MEIHASQPSACRYMSHCTCDQYVPDIQTLRKRTPFFEVRAPLKDELTLYIPSINESIVLLGKLANYNRLNLINNLLRAFKKFVALSIRHTIIHPILVNYVLI